MQFGVLGPVRAWTPVGVVGVGGARQRRLLAALLLHAGEVASTDRLLDIVFEGELPSGASTTIRSYVARLRKSLGEAEAGAEELISTEQGGYRLGIDLDTVDAVRFEASIDTARRRLEGRDPVGAVATLREGLALWRGPAYGEFAFEEWARPEVSRLEELEVVAEEELNDALLACGLAHDVVSATRSQIVEHPLRERLRGQHMLALYRAGRQVEALRSLDEFQQVLVEVGLEPSEELLRLGRGIAAHDSALRLESPAGQPLRGYRVGAALGEGAHGVVYRGVQPGVGREVAIKTIRAQFADDPDFVRRFDAEAQLVANLEHPHVVPIYDYWREPGGAYIVMRLLADNLDGRLADGPLAAAAVAEIAHELGSALAAAHRSGVVHGDIKPSNVLVDDSGAYLSDFGVATLVESVEGDGSISPSSGYESPELLAGGPPSTASDQFALAVLLVQLMTGQLPFGTRAIATPHDRSPSIHVQRPSIPATVDDVVWKATSWHAADRYRDVETFVDHFDAALAGRAEPGSTDHEVLNPYRGLRAFTEVDRSVFFGRGDVVDELVQRLDRDGTDGRFVVAIGASGSGKSSVVRAGLVPKLRSGAVPGSESWLITTMMPGSDPFAELDAALRSVATTESGQRATTPDDSEVIRLLDAAVPPTQPVLLVIDQLEELFTHVAGEHTRRHFVHGLARAVQRRSANLRVVATLRADHLDRPLRYSDFGRLVKNGAVTVVGMSAPELESAITRPAARVGVEVEPALATQLVADVLDQPAALPLLQFTLTELFERRTGPVLTLQSYRDLGGVDAAVASRAEEVYGELPSTGRDVARRVFLRLVAVDESRSVSRRRSIRSHLVSTAGDPSAADTVVDTFGASRLLTFDRDHDSREPTVEIAHEALIDQWPRFADWIASAGDGLRIQGLLTDAASTWEQQGRDEGDLYRGMRLESALEWTEEQPDAPSPIEREFLDASVAARSAEIEAERAQAERDRRTNRRLRGLLAGVAVLLVAALAAGALALWQQRRADDEAAAARSAAAEAEQQREAADAAAAEAEQQSEVADAAAAEAERQSEAAVAALEDADLATLISRSAAQSAENPELSVLLALEAHRRSPGPETEQAVLSALGSSRLPNRIATFPTIDMSSCLPEFTFSSRDGDAMYAHVGGRLVSLDLGTGQITEHASSDEECGLWLGDSLTGRTVAVSADRDRSWVGTFDDPFAIELEQSQDFWLNNTDLRSGVAAFGLVWPGDPVVLFDVTTGEQIGGPIGGPIGGGDLVSTAADPSGSVVAISHRLPGADDGAGRLRLVDARTGDQQHVIDTNAPASSITFDEATDELVAGMADGTMMTVDLATGEVVSEVATTATSEVIEVGVRDDGLVVAVSNGQIELVDRHLGPIEVATGLRDVVEARVRQDGTVVTLAIGGQHDVIELAGNALVERSWAIDTPADLTFRDGQAAVWSSTGPEVALVDLATGERTDIELRDADGEPFVAADVSPEAGGVSALSDSGIFARWEDGTLVERVDLPGADFIGGPRIGSVVATLGVDVAGNRAASVMSVEPGSAGVRFTVPAPSGQTIHPAPDGGVHVFDEDGTLHTYDSNGEPIGVVETGAAYSTTVTMDPATGRLAVDSFGGGVFVVDPETGEVERLPDDDQVASLAFARDGRLLVIAANDGTVRIWDLDRGEPAGIIWDGSAADASWYDPSTDAIWISTSGRLNEIPLDPQRWVERACEVVGRDLTPDERDRYVPGRSNDGGLGAPPRSVCS